MFHENCSPTFIADKGLMQSWNQFQKEHRSNFEFSERLVSLGFMEAQLRGPLWNQSYHHITIVWRSLRGAHNWPPIMPKDASLLDSECDFLPVWNWNDRGEMSYYIVTLSSTFKPSNSIFRHSNSMFRPFNSLNPWINTLQQTYKQIYTII